MKLNATLFIASDDRDLHLCDSRSAFNFDSQKNTSIHEKIFVNYLSMNDSSQTDRDEWMQQTFPQVQVFPFSLTSTSGISRAKTDYEVIAVGGSDVPRAIKFLKDNYAAVRSLIKIAVLHDSRATKRAKLLLAGYDDVFDVSKLRREEARARILSMRSRYATAQETVDREVNTSATLASIAHVGRLGKRERMILLELIAAPSHFCSYGLLQATISDWGDEISANNLKVIISNLRKKLRTGCAILSRTNAGYELIYPK